MAEEKKKKSKSKYVAIDGDDVEKEVSKAMKQVEKAMRQVKIAEKEARQAKKQGKYMGGDYGMRIQTNLPFNMFGQGADGFQKDVTSHQGTLINIHSCENVQVGNNNTMIINKKSKSKSKSKRRSGSDDDDDDDDVELSQEAKAAQQEMEKMPIFSSKRLVTAADIDVICVKVAQWRRFLRFLNLEEVNIEHVHQDYFHSGGVKEVLFQGIKMWQRKEAKGATIDIVARALMKIDCAEAVRELQP